MALTKVKGSVGEIDSVLNPQGIVSADKVITGFDAAGVKDGAWIHFAGRDTVGDGGGGMFRYSSSSTQATDGGTVFAPAGGGRLFREGWTVSGFNGQLNVRWFGAKGDGATDDSAAVQSALNAAYSSSGKSVIFQSGNYVVNSVVDLKNRISIFGAGKNGN